MIAVRDTVARLITDIYSGNLQPRMATGLASLLNLQLRAIETADLERRVAKLEKLLSDAEAEGGLDGGRDVPTLERGDLPGHF